MNKRPIAEARDPDLHSFVAAMERAARRVRTGPGEPTP